MAGTGLLSKDSKLSYKVGEAYTDIPDLQEIPDLGGKPELVDVTTLADTAKRNIDGIVDYGDLEFKFLYDNSGATSSYRVLRGLEIAGAVNDWKVTLPDGTTFAFKAKVKTAVEGTKVNAALTFKATMIMQSAITVTDPVE